MQVTKGTWRREQCVPGSLSSHAREPGNKAGPFPKGTVPFGGSNMLFGTATKETMCPLAPPQNQHS